MAASPHGSWFVYFWRSDPSYFKEGRITAHRRQLGVVESKREKDTGRRENENQQQKMLRMTFRTEL